MMSFNEPKADCLTKVAGPQNEASSRNADLSSTSPSHSSPLLNVSSIFPFIPETYRDLQSYISGLRTDFQLMQTINKYKKGCNQVYAKALESYNLCYQLAQNIARTMDIFKELCTCLSELEEYNYRLCEIMSIFVACELRLSADAAQQDEILIAQRIIYVMRRHLVKEEEQETSHNILKTLVYIPKLFNARDIMCAIFGEFIPLKPVPEVNVLPDKLYMLYIIVFYRWMMMQKDDDDKILIVNFAESFMKPSVSLCSNNVYGGFLPMYAKHSTATRTILNNLKYYGDIRNACIIDNAFKQTGAVVNLCDDEEEDNIIVDTSYTTDFAQVFASIHLEPLNAGISNIKLVQETVVGTAEKEPLRRSSVRELHDKWLNDFQKLAIQYRISQMIVEQQQNKQVILNSDKEAIICLDSDSEEESEEISCADGKETCAANKENNTEDLFADNYPLTNTPLNNCDSDLESLDVDDENDTTKISPRFLSSNLRTYQPKKSSTPKPNDQNKSDASEQSKSLEKERAYRRDSIHISSTPPEAEQDDDDDGTDVQDEKDDLLEEDDETQAYTFLPTVSKRPDKELYPKQIQPMAPYPAYNSMHNEKLEFSRNVSRYSQHYHYEQRQNKHSDSSEIKTPNKQKKRVQFNKNLLGPTIASSEPQKALKPALQQAKYKVSDAKDIYHVRGFERLCCAPSTDDSVSTASSNKQQESAHEKFNNHSTININNNKCSTTFCKNLSVFKQKSFNFHRKQMPIKNVKINLKRIKLSTDISLTNLKSNLNDLNTKQEEPHTNTHKNSSIETESSQLKTCPTTSTTGTKDDDDLIFKKPLPVTKKPSKLTNKVFTSTKPFKIQKVVSLRKTPYNFKIRDPVKAECAKQLNNFDFPLETNSGKPNEVNLLGDNQLCIHENRKKLETTLENNIFDVAGDDLSKISKLLTDEINSLTCETNTSRDIIETKYFESRQDKQNKDPTKIVSDSISDKSANEEEQKDKIGAERTAKQIELINSNMDEIVERTLAKKDETTKAANNVFVNFEKPARVLESSNPRASDENLLCSQTSGINLPSSEEDLPGKTMEDNEISSSVTLGTVYSGRVPQNEIGENKNAADDAIHTKDAEISKPLEKQVESKKTIEKDLELTQKLVTNFSAEFLAGLPNEPSPSSIDAEESNCGSKNEMDFEFDNNCSTPTMCRIDLDVMSDVPAVISSAMCISECEADKLLEDFNNKSEDIVGCTLNKKSVDSNILFSENPKNLLSIGENNNKFIASITSNNDVDPAELNNDLACETNQESRKRLRDNDDSEAKQGCNQNLVKPKNDAKSLKSIDVCDESKRQKTENKKLKLFNDVNEPVMSKNNVSILCKEEHQQTNIKNFNKIGETNSEQTFTERIDGGSEDIDKNTQNNCAKQDQCGRYDLKSQETENSINENQHMTVELANCCQNEQDKGNTVDSETGGVSAIFSFPKIPIISISIHTTPNNKTYFKISNRENDNETKDGVMMKKFKSSHSDDETKKMEEDDAVTVSNHQNEKQTSVGSQIGKMNVSQANGEEKEVTSILQDNVCNDMDLTQRNQVEDDDEDDDEDIEKCEINEEDEEEEFDDGDIDNFEIEKFSHDSNSACSLPLKKRPTQTESNGDTNDSQTSESISYDQPQEIAAEVIIENISKDKTLLNENTLLQLQEKSFEPAKQEGEAYKDAAQKVSYASEIDDNKPSTSSACFKNLADSPSAFKRRVQTPTRSNGQTPIQIVTPQLKDSPITPNQDYRTMDSQVSSVSRMSTQCIQPLLESYPATPMLSVANVEKLMDFNRFIEDLLASPDVMTIIDNANACGYFAEGQTYELERIAILEHYNIANAKGSTTVTKPLYWKKSAGDTISIFNDNDNEWISLPPSTSKQLQKLSFVLSILQQQYKVSDVRQRINIALAFLIRNTSKYKNTSTPSQLQQCMPLYSRNVPDYNNSQHLASSSFFRIAANNENLNQNLNMNSSTENVQNFHSTNDSANTNNHNFNNAVHFASSTTAQVTEQTNLISNPQMFSSNNVEIEPPQPQQHSQTADKRSSSWDELSTDQLYVNPPCATSPQNEVIVNTNGVELLDIPEDPQNIFISITDETGTSNAESSALKYNTRHQVRTSEDLETVSPSTFHSQKNCFKRSCLANNGATFISNNFMRHNIIPTFGNQEINLQNPYRLQQQQQSINTSANPNFAQRHLTQQNSPITIFNNRQSSPSSQHQQNSNQVIPSRFTTTFNTQLSLNPQHNQSKSNDSNFKEILQPYITYLIKDHEKTSKHLLQVFEEVSNSSTPNGPVVTNLHQHQHQFKSLLPPLIRNPQQNHMPGFHQITDNCANVLPSLIRNPHHTTLITRDSGALQVVQSFIEQSQTNFDTSQQKADHQLQQQKIASSPSAVIPGFAKEYVNFVDIREQLRNNNEQQQEAEQPHVPQTQSNDQFGHMQQEPERLSSVKRKCQERNDKLAEDLKRKIVEFTLLKHNVQVKLLEKEQKQQGDINPIQNVSITTRRRGRPKKVLNKSQMENNTGTILSAARVTRRRQTKSDLSTTVSTIDHAYFRQRTAAREAAKRINAALNTSFH